jgi:hypothetical protein
MEQITISITPLGNGGVEEKSGEMVVVRVQFTSHITNIDLNVI